MEKGEEKYQEGGKVELGKKRQEKRSEKRKRLVGGSRVENICEEEEEIEK